MFHQAWEETLPASGDDLDEHVLDNLYQRQVIESTLMKHAMTLHQQYIVLKKAPRSNQTLRTMVDDTVEQQQQHMLICHKE